MFRLLDFTTPLEEYREHVATLQCAALWFLGDCVDFFTDSSADCAALLQALLECLPPDTPRRSGSLLRAGERERWE